MAAGPDLERKREMAVEKPAIEGGTPVRSEVLPYATQWLQQEEIDAVVNTLKSVWITTGPKEKEFTEKYAEYVGAKHAVAVSSCTAALNLSVIGAGIGPGDEVITTPMTFVATTLAIIHAGATPIFADIEEDTLNMDVNTIEDKITEKTKAILPMHYGGNPVKIDRVLEIAKKHGLKVVEDAAHASGAAYKGKKIGVFGDMTCFSFHAIKNMTCAEGGMITTDNTEVAEWLKTMSFFGIPMDAYKRASSDRPWHYDVEDAGFKYNMTDIAASMGLVQLPRLDGFNARRAELVKMYNEAFAGSDEIITPGITEGAEPSYHLYVVKLRDDVLSVDRDRVLAALRAENIFANIHYVPVYKHPYFQRTMKQDVSSLPVCENVNGKIVTLPLFPRMTDGDLQDVVTALKKIIAYYRK